MTQPRLHDRAVIRLSPAVAGEDVRAFLQGLVTQDMTAALPLWAGLLTAQGKALFDFIVWPADEDVLIDCEASVAAALIRRLSMYRLRRQIAIAVDPALGVYWMNDGVGDHPDPRLPALGQRWVAPLAVDDRDVTPAYHAHRLALGVTEGVAELGSDATLWLECNADELNGVSFTKGCYVGQENTARMNWRSKVNRRLVVVPLTDADPKRQRVAYDALGLSVELRRVEAIVGDTWRDWMGEREVDQPA